MKISRPVMMPLRFRSASSTSRSSAARPAARPATAGMSAEQFVCQDNFTQLMLLGRP